MFRRGVEKDQSDLCIQLTKEEIGPFGGGEGLETPGREYGVALSKLDSTPIVFEEIIIPALSMIPGKGFSTVRVAGTGQADLIPVVDAWGSGHGHLEKDAET